jgi:hypothetical protein
MPWRTYRGRVPVGEGAGATPASGSAGRVVALGAELRRLHDRIRDVLDDALEGVDGVGAVAAAAALGDDLTLRCRAVCTTLGDHHRDEDAALFPWLRAGHPGMASVVDRLEQDHAMIGSLLAELERVVRGGGGAGGAGGAGDAGGAGGAGGADVRVVRSHLEGIDAIMESHFRFEERELVPLLDAIVGDGPPLPHRFWRAG